MQQFQYIAAIFIVAGIASAIVIAVDLRSCPQRMRIMRSVWILTGLWAHLIGLKAYFAFGRPKPCSETPSPQTSERNASGPGMHAGGAIGHGMGADADRQSMQRQEMLPQQMHAGHDMQAMREMERLRDMDGTAEMRNTNRMPPMRSTEVAPQMEGKAGMQDMHVQPGMTDSEGMHGTETSDEEPDMESMPQMEGMDGMPDGQVQPGRTEMPGTTDSERASEAADKRLPGTERMPHPKNMPGMAGMRMAGAMEARPRWQSVVLSTLHCGAGCTLADLVGEWFLFFVPLSVAGSLIAGTWIVDYLLALLFGIGFQYAAIREMEPRASAGDILRRATKADILSLTAWQAGMYGWMALVIFVFNDGVPLSRTTFGFWFMMQIAMACGFALSLPVNLFLIRKGIKHGM